MPPDSTGSEPLTAPQILERSRRAYLGFSVLRASCAMVRDGLLARGDEAPNQLVSSARASFEFERDARLFIDCFTGSGHHYRALWTPDEAWIETGTLRAGGRESKRENIEGKEGIGAYSRIVGGLTGVTHGAASLLPSALQDSNWSNPFPSTHDALEVRPPQRLGAVWCYVVEARREERERVETLWIEAETFLLRRLNEERGAVDYANEPAVPGHEPLSLRVFYKSSSYAFATAEAR